jgi:DNA polymerase III subunit delta'
MFFKDIIGQEKIKNRLIQSVKESRISHAQLFLGPEGSGSLPMAVAFAQYLHCQNKQENDSCGNCPACKKMENLVHPDVHYSFPIVKSAKSIEGVVRSKDPVSDNFIDDWRSNLLKNNYINLNQWLNALGLENKQASIYTHESDEIIKKLSLKSFESEYKVLIMWMPEKMNDNAANKLLKLIEEPPAKTLFILVAENQDQIIKTILSRTQIVHFQKMDDASMFDALKANYDLKDQQIWDIIKLANGNFTKAKELIESTEENDLFFEKFTVLMRMAFKKDYGEIMKWVDDIFKFGREKQKNFLMYCSRLIRENFISNYNQEQIVYFTEQEKAFAQKFSPYINHKNIMLIYEEFKTGHYQIQRNVNARLIFMDLALKLNKLLKM